MTPILHNRECTVCLTPFRSVRKRMCCSLKCDAIRIRQIRQGSRSSGATTRHWERAQRAGETHDRECETWLHERIADWYREKHAERAAEGVSQPIPLAVVLACHAQGLACFTKASLVRSLANLEDRPGKWESEVEDECD